MSKVSKNNISKTLDDVRRPGRLPKTNLSMRQQEPRVTAQPLHKNSPVSETASKNNYLLIKTKQCAAETKSKKSCDLLKKAAVIFLVLIINVYIFNLLNFKDLLSGKVLIIYEEFVKGKNAIAQFKPEIAESAFLAADQELSAIQKRAKISGFNFIPVLSEIPTILGSVSNFNQASLAITRDINFLKNNGLNLALNNGGEQIIKTLGHLNNNVENLITSNTEIKNQSSKLKNLSSKIASFADAFSNNYLDISLNLYKTKEWLNSLLAILKSPEEQHILLIFQNPSEMRPSGGFIGSHADITIEKGSIKNIAIDDIYNADRQLDLKLIPPKQLQSLTKNWGARDANWFFDFPTSARKVIYLLENSDLYKEKSTKFLGAAAINVDVLEGLLEITGPIEVPQYQMTLTKENFLREIQYEVEAGQDKKPGQNPKKILSVAAPLILEKLTNLPEDKKALIFENLRKHCQNKDVMFYFKNFSLEDLAVKTGMGGEIFSTPADFQGDYLAVISANIAGGKTDAFIDQKIFLKSEVQNDGSIHNDLTVERNHSGQNEKEWWYNTTNKNFVKILVPQNSSLKGIAGNYYKTINPSINYNKAGYEYDLELKGIENSSLIDRLQAELGQELDKTYFATWFDVAAGTKKSLELQYENPHQISIKDGAVYKFVFDKQSGINGSLQYSVSAPIGYAWKETGNENFEYFTENPKAREIIELTLQKL